MKEYFSHDYHARHDPKLSALIKDFGMEGYGVWWYLVETMHEQGGKIEKFPKLFESIASEMKQNEATLKQIISALIKDFMLLNEDSTHIWSERVLRNIQALYDKRMQKVVAGRLGGIESGKKRSKTKQNEATLEANEAKRSKTKQRLKQTKQSKEKESKVNKRNANKYSVKFDEIWNKYPNRIGKKQAYKHFCLSVKNEIDYENINKALDNYLCSDRVKRGFVQNGSTWFNNWQDWYSINGGAKKFDFEALKKEFGIEEEI